MDSEKRSDLVLLPGWGVDVSCWSGVAEQLKGEFNVVMLPLPSIPALNGLAVDSLLEAWLRDLLERAPARAYWLGWSLGGMLVMALRQCYPERLLGGAVVAAAPRFVDAADWPGVPRSVLADFERDLQSSPESLQRRFLALATHGDRAVLRGIKPVPHGAALEQGLQLLAELDLREEQGARHLEGALLSDIDGVLPPSLMPDLQAFWGDRLHLTSTCHAPMVSAPATVAEFVRDCFCR